MQQPKKHHLTIESRRNSSHRINHPPLIVTFIAITASSPFLIKNEETPMSAFVAVLRYSFLLFVKVSASRMSVCFAKWMIIVKLEATIHENLFFVPCSSVSQTRRSNTTSYPCVGRKERERKRRMTPCRSSLVKRIAICELIAQLFSSIDVSYLFYRIFAYLHVLLMYY